MEIHMNTKKHLKNGKPYELLLPYSPNLEKQH